MDDLKLKITLIADEAQATFEKLSAAVDKTKDGVKKLKEELKIYSGTAKAVEKETNKLTTDHGKLKTNLIEDKKALKKLTDEIREHSSQIKKDDVSMGDHKKTLISLTSQYRETNTSIKKNTNKLRENSRASDALTRDLAELRTGETVLKRSIDATTHSQALQTATMRKAARQRAGLGSFAAAIGRGGFTKGGLISGGAALGVGGFLGSGAAMVGLGISIAGGAALFKSASVGMNTDRILTETVARPGPAINKEDLRNRVKKANSASLFDLEDTASAFLAVRRASGAGIDSVEGMSKAALLFGQAENLGAEESANMLIKSMTLLNKPLDEKSALNVGNFMAAAESLSPDKVGSIFTALTSGAKELKQFGKLSDSELFAVITLLSKSGFGGSKISQLRTTLLSNKDTPKVAELTEKISSLTGTKFNILDQAGNLLPIMDILESINKLYKGGDATTKTYIEKFISTAFNARGSSKIQALLDLGDRGAIKDLAKQLEGIVDSNLLKTLSDARLGTAEGKFGLAKSELGNTLESFFIQVLESPLVAILTDVKQKFIGLTSFFETSPMLTGSMGNIIKNLASSVTSVVEISGLALTPLVPAIEYLTHMLAVYLLSIKGLIRALVDPLVAKFQGKSTKYAFNRAMLLNTAEMLMQTSAPGSPEYQRGEAIIQNVQNNDQSAEILRNLIIPKLQAGRSLTFSQIGTLKQALQIPELRTLVETEAFPTVGTSPYSPVAYTAITPDFIKNLELRAQRDRENLNSPESLAIRNSLGNRPVVNNVTINIPGAKNPEEIAKEVKKIMNDATFNSGLADRDTEVAIY